MCWAVQLFYYVFYVLFIFRNNKTLQVSFRFREAQRFARTFERPSVANVYWGKVQFLLYITLDITFSKKKKKEKQESISRQKKNRNPSAGTKDSTVSDRWLVNFRGHWTNNKSFF